MCTTVWTQLKSSSHDSGLVDRVGSSCQPYMHAGRLRLQLLEGGYGREPGAEPGRDRRGVHRPPTQEYNSVRSNQQNYEL